MSKSNNKTPKPTTTEVVEEILNTPDPQPADEAVETALEALADNPILGEALTDVLEIVEAQEEAGRPKLAARIGRTFGKLAGSILPIAERLASALEKTSEERIAVIQKNGALLAHFQGQAAVPPEDHSELYKRTTVLEGAYKELVTHDVFAQLEARIAKIESAEPVKVPDISALDSKLAALEKLVNDKFEALPKPQEPEKVDLSGYSKTDSVAALEDRIKALEARIQKWGDE